MKVITFCPHIQRTEEEKQELYRNLFTPEHEGRIFVIQEVCDECFVILTKGILPGAAETTH